MGAKIPQSLQKAGAHYAVFQLGGNQIFKNRKIRCR
jgi:hypothetical protein